MHQSVTTVSLFDQLDTQATKFIFEQTKMTTLCIEKNQLKSICEAKVGDTLKNLIIFGEVDDTMRDLAKKNSPGLTLFSFGEVCLKGNQC